MLNFKRLKNEAGSALMVAIFFTLFLMFLVTQISTTTISEYLVANKELKRVQAYYASDACMELSLLRIKLFQQAQSALGSQIPDPSMLDLIWQFPMSWPPAIPQGMNSVVADEMKQAAKVSLMKSSWTAQIQSEGGKIDLNDLASPSQTVAQATRKQLMDVVQRELQDNRDFADKYSGYRFEEMFNNIADWIDPDNESRNGGPESGFYSSLGNNRVPPNQGLKTMQELHLIAGMNDDIYNLLKDRVTIYGIKGINPNQAPQEVLKSLDISMNDNVIKDVLERRNDPKLGGPFKTEEDFLGFIQGRGANTQAIKATGVAFSFDPTMNFRIECFGQVGDVTRKSTAVVFDFDRVKNRLSQFVTKDQQQSGQTPMGAGDCANYTGQSLITCQNCQALNPAQRQSCMDGIPKGQNNNTQAQNSQTTQVRPGRPNVIFFQED